MPVDGHHHPSLTADVIVFALGEGGPNVLLIQRGRPPFRGEWAFPGGFVEVGESPRDAASRELEEETGILGLQLEQLRAFGDPGRDPRGHTVTVAYLAVVAQDKLSSSQAGSDAAQVRWWSIGSLPPLAFDHSRILVVALRRLYSKLACLCGALGSENTLPGDLSLGDVRANCRAIAERLEVDTGSRRI